MADLWYVKVRPNGVVYKAYCDDHEPVQEGDIPLDPKWYWGQAPGVTISDRHHGDKYRVENGRLVPLYDNSKEMAVARDKKERWIDEFEGSPILSKAKKDKLPEADYEAYLHVQNAINEVEVIHARKCGY